MIKIQCPCGEIFNADNQHIGKHIQCKNCKSILSIHENASPVPATTGEKGAPESSYKPSKLSKNMSPRLRKKIKVGVLSVIALISLSFLYAHFSPVPTQTENARPLLEDTPEEKYEPIRTKKPGVAMKKDNYSKPAKRMYVVDDKERGTVDKIDKYKTAPTPAEKPINPNRLPLGAEPFGTGLHAGKSMLTLDNGSDTDAIVRVLRISPTKELIRNFYIPSGTKFSAKQLPPGDYILRIAFGQDWDEQKRHFKFDQSFSQSESFDITESVWNEDTEGGYIRHTEASNLSVTLHRVLNGNFKTHPISEAQFWQ